jgi:hypothetical protein
MTPSLYDVAPRLALARDQRRYEIAVIDGDGFSVGDDFFKILRAEHRVDRCGVCGGEYDVHTINARQLVPHNRGRVTSDTLRTCRRCGRGHDSYR